MSDKETTSQVIKGLYTRPAYLLIYGICLISATLAYRTTRSATGSWDGWPWVALLAGLLVSLIVIVVLEKPTRASVLTGHSAFDTHLLRISESLKKSLGVPHPEFQKVVVAACEDLASRLRNIQNGQVAVKGKDYHHFMRELLAAAKSSIECVHKGRYFADWYQNIGRSLIDEGEQNKATVCRIIVFDTRTEITAEVLALLRRLISDKGGVYLLYIDDEDANYKFPDNQFPRDFALLDGGDAICESFRDEDSFIGTWFFNDSLRRDYLRQEFQKLKRYSTFRMENEKIVNFQPMKNIN